MKDHEGRNPQEVSLEDLDVKLDKLKDMYNASNFFENNIKYFSAHHQQLFERVRNTLLKMEKQLV